jgi:hypothetical protein
MGKQRALKNKDVVPAVKIDAARPVRYTIIGSNFLYVSFCKYDEHCSQFVEETQEI